VGEDLRHAIRDNHVGDLSNRLRIASISRARSNTFTQKTSSTATSSPTTSTSTLGKVKLMDFGIAKAEVSISPAPDSRRHSLIHVAGAGARRAGHRVDGVYASAFCFRTADRQKPVEGDTLERLFYAILNEP